MTTKLSHLAIVGGSVMGRESLQPGHTRPLVWPGRRAAPPRGGNPGRPGGGAGQYWARPGSAVRVGTAINLALMVWCTVLVLAALTSFPP